MSTYASKAPGRNEIKDETDDQLIEKFKRWFKLVTETEAKQREREIEDLKFQVGEYQWDPLALKERRGDANAGVPPRPALSISLIQQPIQLIKNQAEAADLGVNVHPVSEKADKENAEIRQSIYRAIERDSNAEQVRLRALDRAIQCGRGWYRIITAWDEEGDHPFDQKILIDPILHQENVYMDPASVQPDYSDARYGFFVSWMPHDDFKRDYPDAKASQDEFPFSDLQTEAPDWVRYEESRKDVLVAEVWEKKIHKTTLCLYADGSFKVKEPGQKSDGKVIAERDREDVELCWYKVTGFEILDREVCDGKLIPLVFVPGRELQGFDGERRWEGMVRPARDGQRLFNYAASSLVERMALEPKVPFIGYEGQFTDPGWKSVNTRNHPFIQVPIKPDGSGGALPIPARAQLDSTGMSLAMMALQEGKGFVQAATAIYDPSLGETPKKGQSGRAVIAQQQQADAGTSNYLQNLANISMRYEALVILDLQPHVYNRPGRVLTVIGGEDKEKQVMLNAPYTMTPEGKPQRVVGPNTEGAKRYDLSTGGGKYSISISVGQSYQTRLQQGQEAMSALLEHLPPEAQVLLLPVMLSFSDAPGHDDAAEIMTKYRDSKFPGLVNDEGEQPTPQQLQSQLQGMQQQAQMMQQQLQLAMEEIKTEQAKQQAQMFKAELDSKTSLEKTRMDNEARITVERMKQQTKGAELAEKEHADQIVLGETHGHETVESEKDRRLELTIHREKMAHDVGMGAAGGNTVTRTREGGQDQESEESQESSRGQSRQPPEPEGVECRS